MENNYKFVTDWELIADTTPTNINPAKWERIKNFNKMNSLFPPVLINKSEDDESAGPEYTRDYNYDKS